MNYTVELNDGITMYNVEANKFRIKQRGKKDFVIEKLFETKKIKGYLWWKKETSLFEWKRVDVNADKFSQINSIRYYSNNGDLFKTYKTLNKALKWIKNYAKYPIYH